MNINELFNTEKSEDYKEGLVVGAAAAILVGTVISAGRAVIRKAKERKLRKDIVSLFSKLDDFSEGE